MYMIYLIINLSSSMRKFLKKYSLSYLFFQLNNTFKKLLYSNILDKNNESNVNINDNFLKLNSLPSQCIKHCFIRWYVMHKV